MAIKEIEVTLEGLSPLLMHKFPMDTIEGFEKKTREEQAEYTAYRMPDTNELYIPGINLQRAFISGATYCKGKGRGSLQKQAAACMMIKEEYCGLGTKKYEIDSRPVVVPATKGRIVRHRARLDKWKVSFTIQYDDILLNEKNVRDIVENTCTRVGYLDFRPEKKGPFGRAMITRWDKN